MLWFAYEGFYKHPLLRQLYQCIHPFPPDLPTVPGTGGGPQSSQRNQHLQSVLLPLHWSLLWNSEGGQVPRKSRNFSVVSKFTLLCVLFLWSCIYLNLNCSFSWNTQRDTNEWWNTKHCHLFLTIVYCLTACWRSCQLWHRTVSSSWLYPALTTVERAIPELSLPKLCHQLQRYEGCPRKLWTSFVTRKVTYALNSYFHIFKINYLCTKFQNIIYLHLILTEI